MTSPITVESIEAKMDKGEQLTPEESKFVMSLPPDGVMSAETGDPDDNVDWDQTEDGDHSSKPKEKTEEEKQKEAEGAAANQKKSDLSVRAKSLGLKDNATEEEIVAAEKVKQETDDEKDPLVRLERELQKPDGKEDLSKFTAREKAYFFTMKRERKARQEAEAKADALAFENLKSKKGEGKKEEVDDPLSELKKKDPTDFMTVSDVLKVVESISTGKPKEEASGPGVNQANIRYLKMCDKEAAAAHPEDYESVMELTDTLLNSNPAYLKQVAEDLMRGENPAETSYRLIKSDPEFAKLFPAAQTRVLARKAKPEAVPVPKTQDELEKERKAKVAQDAFKNNQSQNKTTAHAAGSEDVDHAKEYSDGKISYTNDQLINMSAFQFSRVPKKIRNEFLKDNGM